jgi:hypothetical protein
MEDQIKTDTRTGLVSDKRKKKNSGRFAPRSTLFRPRFISHVVSNRPNVEHCASLNIKSFNTIYPIPATLYQTPGPTAKTYQVKYRLYAGILPYLVARLFRLLS